MLMPARRARATPRDGVAPAARRRAGSTAACCSACRPIMFALQYGLVRDTEYGVALSALVLAAFYVALAAGAARASAARGRRSKAALAVGTVFLTLVIPFALDARSTAGAWALEGAGLVWLGLRQARRLSRVVRLCAVAAGRRSAMLYAHDRYGVPRSPWNAYLFSALMRPSARFAARVTAACWCGATARRRSAGRTPARWHPRRGLARAAADRLGHAVADRRRRRSQIDAFVPARCSSPPGSQSSAPSRCCTRALAMRLGWRTVAWPVIGHAPMRCCASPARQRRRPARPAHGGAWAWPVALAAHLGASLWRARFGRRRRARACMRSACSSLATLGALQGARITAALGRRGRARGRGSAGSRCRRRC